MLFYVGNFHKVLNMNSFANFLNKKGVQMIGFLRGMIVEKILNMFYLMSMVLVTK